MKQTIANQRSRAGRMQDFFAAKNSFIAPYVDISNAITQFNDALPQFDDFADKQKLPITGYAAEKKDALNEAADIVTKWGIRCHRKAEESGMLPLAELLSHTEREITGEEDVEGLSLMKDIRNGLNDNLTLFTEQGLTAAVITEIDGKISAYQAVINSPKVAISERKMETEALRTLMKEINNALKIIVPLLEAAWKGSHPELVVEMLNNYQIDDLGHRFTGIGGVLNPVPGVTNVGDINLGNYKVVCQSLTGKTYESMTNMIGEYKIQSMRAGFYECKLKSPEGVVVKTAIIKIERGQTLDYNWTV